MTEITVKSKCTNCGGDGMVTVYNNGVITGTSPCNWPGCVDGYIDDGKFFIDPGTDDIIDKCNDILNKCDDLMSMCKDILEQLTTIRGA